MTQLEKYAKLLIYSGVNVQENQTLVISAPVQLHEFVNISTKFAYEKGAREVIVKWSDEQTRRMFFEFANDEVFDEANEWLIKQTNHFADIDACFLSISASDPELMKGIDQTRISRQSKAYSKYTKEAHMKRMNNKNAWCVASMPTKPWAKKVFPDLSEDEALDALWNAILSATRADLDDPVAAWEEHQNNLNTKLDFLNKIKFKSVKYKNSLGTDVTVGLPENQIWFGGGDEHIPKGYTFIANIPTEEIFSAPHRDQVDGKIVSSYPLNRNGVLITDFWFEFKDGIIVDYGAKDNLEALKEIVENDAGSNRLGEIALVPYDSPISNQNILFYNTLFDENASCHFAVGSSYPVCVKGGEDMSDEELHAEGANTSDTHVDFMVGTEDLSIIGITKDGEEIAIFENGNFVI